MKKLILALGLVAFIFPFGLKAADHGALNSIELSPIEAQVKAGENLTLTLTAKDTAGATWDISQNAVYQVNDPRGKMEDNIYLAGKIGTFTITAAYGNFTAQTLIQVLPGDLTTIIVNPNSRPEIIDLGNQVTFNAEGYDKMSNLLAGLTFNWSAEGNLGDINDKGVFSATDTGEGKIIASIDSISGFSAIRIKERTLLPSAAVTNNSFPASTDNTASSNSNDNGNDNNDVNGQVAGAEIAAAAETTETKDECKTIAWYWWVLIMIGFFAVLIAYYYFIRKSKSGWWWIFPLILTAAVVWLYYQYACGKYGWWPWVTIIMAMLITLFRPKKFFEEPKSPTF
ncbi:MAG: hypothetical protein ABIH38_00440 [Patescibacteria group bacterium]